MKIITPHATIDAPTVYPYSRPIHPAFEGGITWSTRQSVPIARHHRNGQPVCRPEIDSRNPSALRGDYIYGGPFLSEFGHFLSESMHRLGISREVNPTLPVIFAGPQLPLSAPSPALPQYAIELLNFVGIKQSEVHIATKPIRVDSLYVAAQGSDLGRGPKDWYLDWLDGFTRDRILKLGITPLKHERIYISRSNYLEGGFLGEKFFEQRLADRGFLIFRPEDYSIVSQFGFYIGAETILIGEGSACHGIELIGRSLKNVGYFNRRHPTKSKAFISTLAPRSEIFRAFEGNIFLGTLPISNGPTFDNKGITLLNWSGMIKFVNELGFDCPDDYAEKVAYVEAAKADLNRYINIRKSLLKDPTFKDDQATSIRDISAKFVNASRTLLKT